MMDMGTPRILVVDDEGGVRDLIVDALSLASLSSTTASHGMEALTKLREESVDLVILDINMPTMDGYEVLQKMRESGITIPVIVLTARLDREDTKRAFELGADDFVRKPFGIEELTLRVQAILRRSQANHPFTSVIQAGEITMDIDRHVVSLGGNGIDVSPTEFRLLQEFLVNPDRILSKEHLLTQVWGVESYADPNVVETYVSYLRKKFGAGLPLRTVRGVGYQLSLRVTS
jgi:two-component system, OmpR family, response regulator